MAYRSALFEFHWTPSQWFELKETEKALIIELMVDEGKRRESLRKK